MKNGSKIPVCYWFPALGGICIGFISLSLAPVANHFMELFKIEHGSLGLFLSALFWTHALAQIPAGILADRLGVIKTLGLASLLQIACSLLPFLSPENIYLAFGMRLIMGLATGLFFLSLVKALTMLAKPDQLIRGQGIQGAAFFFGSMLPYIVLPFWGKTGWALAYIIGALLSIIVLLAMLKIPREPLQIKKESMNWKDLGMAVKKSLKNRDILMLGCFHGFSFGSLNTIANWLPLIILDNVPGGDLSIWAFITGGVFLSGTLARVLGGELGRHFNKIHIIIFCTMGIAAIYILMTFCTNPYLLVFLGLCMGLFCGSTYASIFTLTTILAEPGYTATGVGVMNTIANLANVILIIILGHIREYTGSFSLGLAIAGIIAFSYCLLTFGKRKNFYI